jgi:hypothetical protein
VEDPVGDPAEEGSGVEDPGGGGIPEGGEEEEEGDQQPPRYPGVLDLTINAWLQRSRCFFYFYNALFTMPLKLTKQ